MSSYKGRVVLITGASSGIGAAIAEDLVKSGLIVIGAARRVERIEALAEKLKGEPGRLVPRKLDVGVASEIQDTFKWAEKELGGIDVLINNAAIMIPKPIVDYTTEEFKQIIDVNLISTLVSSKEAVKGFAGRKLNDGYIININSIAGHRCPHLPGTTLGIYPMSKYGLTAECVLMRQYLKDTGIKARVTSLSPGAVLTEMTTELNEKGWVADFLLPQDLARTVNFLLSLPTSVEVTELTVQPAGEIL